MFPKDEQLQPVNKDDTKTELIHYIESSPSIEEHGIEMKPEIHTKTHPNGSQSEET